MLINHGVPFDVAFAMDHTMRRAWIIVLGQAEGGHWDWDMMTWREDR